MGFKCGIVGLPNVGKSTLFNALTKTAAAQAANYPFCTIEPNTGEVAVPDRRLKQIADVAGSKEIIPTRISFVDIAGLVRGASKGEGLGNQFLANIREVDAIVHVLRCFEDDDITHVEGRIDPVADAETIETELMLADLESLERRTDQTRKKATGKDKEAMTVLPMMEAALKLLHDGKPARILLDGMLIGLLKPKLSLFFLAFLPQFAPADAPGATAHMLMLAGVFMALTLVVFIGYAAFASAARRHILSRPTVLRWMRRSLAGVFGFLSLRLALSER